uniref:SANTA domain-containing protein n=1 Tax=Noccaea caerulescens TaxID=107243 RepID=A0A1J3CU39_NOCCA
MADYRKTNLDGDGASGCSSFQKTVILSDWWLIKCSNEFEGKRFGVSGTEVAASVESRAKRVFTSSPIIKAFDVFTIQASDGICINLRGFLNKERVVKSGFLPEISREFIFGFPPCWEQICNNCFRDVNTIPTISHKACFTTLSSCKNTKGNLQDSPAESRRDKSTVTEKNMAESNDKDDGGDKKTARRKSLRLQSSSGHKSKLQNATSDGNEGLDKGKSSDVENDDCETIDFEDIGRKLDEAINTDDGDHPSEGFDKAINIEVIPPANGCADNVDHVPSTSATGESEQRKGELKVTRASPRSISKDLDKSSKPGKKGKSKKSGKTLKNVVEPMNRSRSKVKEAVETTLSGGKTKRKINFDVEVTPDKEEKVQKTNTVSTDSVGQKRSRSGRVLVSPLEFWRDQIPVYDMDRNLTQVKEGHGTNSTPSKGKKSIGFSKGKKMKII